jgi:hypothetical protein
MSGNRTSLACTPAVPGQKFHLLRREALALFPLADLCEELLALRKALGLRARNKPPDDIEETEWHSIAMDLTITFGPVFSDAACAAWAQRATERDRQALAVQLQRALRAVNDASSLVDSIGSAVTGALLPISFSQRVLVLLGSGDLPVAWVRCIAVTPRIA